MPTIEDLREAFDHLATQAPDALAEPVHPAHRRRTAVLLAAACTAVVAVGVPVALGRDDAAPPSAPVQPTVHRHTLPKILPHSGFTALPAPADGESPDLAYGFAFPDPVAGYTITPDALTRTYQHASIYGPMDPPGGQVFVFYRGAFDPSALADRQPAEVGGHQAFTGDYTFPNGEGPAPVLAWEYADDGWAVLFLGVLHADGTPQDGGHNKSGINAQHAAALAAHEAMIRRNEILIADAMIPVRSPLLTPIRISGSVATQVDAMSADSGPDGTIQVYDGNAGRQWLFKWSSHPLDSANTTTIHGHEWDLRSSLDGPSSILLIGDQFGLTITTPSPATTTELEAFAAAIDLAADPSDRSTWFPAADALP